MADTPEGARWVTVARKPVLIDPQGRIAGGKVPRAWHGQRLADRPWGNGPDMKGGAGVARQKGRKRTGISWGNLIVLGAVLGVVVLAVNRNTQRTQQAQEDSPNALAVVSQIA